MGRMGTNLTAGQSPMEALRMLKEKSTEVGSAVERLEDKIMSAVTVHPAIEKRYQTLTSNLDAFNGICIMTAQVLALGVQLPSVATLSTAVCKWTKEQDETAKKIAWLAVDKAIDVVNAEAVALSKDLADRRMQELKGVTERASQEEERTKKLQQETEAVKADEERRKRLAPMRMIEAEGRARGAMESAALKSRSWLGRKLFGVSDKDQAAIDKAIGDARASASADLALAHAKSMPV